VLEHPVQPTQRQQGGEDQDRPTGDMNQTPWIQHRDVPAEQANDRENPGHQHEHHLITIEVPFRHLFCVRHNVDSFARNAIRILRRAWIPRRISNSV
jgi:hypothetical protein